MTRRRLALAFAGLAVGAGAALAVLLAFGGEEEAAVTVATTTSTTAAPPVTWVDADEIALGPTVMVVEGLTVEDGEAVLAYDLFDINPVEPGRLLDSDSLTGVGLDRLAEEAAVAPELWTLITAGGEIPGTTSSPRARTARFSLPGGALPEVLGLRLDRYWMRIPYAFEAALPLDSTVPLDAGYSLAVGRVIEQTDSKIVQVDLVTPGAMPPAPTPGSCSSPSGARGGPSPAAAPPPGCSWCTTPPPCPTPSGSPPGPPTGSPSTDRC